MAILRRTKYLAVGLILASLFSGCSLFQKADDLEKKDGSAAQAAASAKNPITPEDDKEIKKIITKYCEKLFSLPINSTPGDLTALNEFLASRTINEGMNNPEVGIHTPRYVGLNGKTVIGYEVIKNKDGAKIDTSFVGKEGDFYTYYTKIGLMAQCVSDEEFNKKFKIKPDYSYEVSGAVDKNAIELYKVEARYDIEIVKDNKKFKILTSREASYKADNRSRMIKDNNDFITKIPYLDENSDDFKSEKEVMITYFNNLTKIDNERSNLLKAAWEKNLDEFKKYFDKLYGITKNKESKEIILLDMNYKENFNIQYFPLMEGMSGLKRYNNIKVIPHPLYSDKQKKYILKFDACVEMLNGILGDNVLYKYDYTVDLVKQGKDVKIKAVKMNGFAKSEDPQSYIDMADKLVNDKKLQDAVNLLENAYYITYDKTIKTKLDGLKSVQS
ncbi:MAG: hypothetical protein N2645_19110 [Clostridia bacterium]|nr:hypothetical protein [Clostridia bacterium]